VGAQKKSRIYDVENFDLSYSFSEIYHRNVDIEYDVEQNYMGGIGYNFNTNPKNIKPFEKIGFISKTKALQFLKDFNFYFLPKMFSFRTDMNRMYNERKLRNKSFGNVITNATYNKTWDWNRIYDLKFDLAQSLTFSFNAVANSYIDEYPESNKILWDKGDLDGDGFDDEITPDQKQQKVKDEIFSGGTKSRYTQMASFNYNLPINKLPLLDWVTATAGYNVSYNWTAPPKAMKALGNTISNNVNWNINGNADLNKLYNKLDFLKKINSPPRKRSGKKGQKKQAKNPDDTTKVTKPKVNYGKIAYETVLKLLMSVKKYPSSILKIKELHCRGLCLMHPYLVTTGIKMLRDSNLFLAPNLRALNILTRKVGFLKITG